MFNIEGFVKQSFVNHKLWVQNWNSWGNNFKLLKQRVQFEHHDHEYKFHALGYDVILFTKHLKIALLAITRIMDIAQLNILREWNTPMDAMGLIGYFVSIISAVNKNQNLVKASPLQK